LCDVNHTDTTACRLDSPQICRTRACRYGFVIKIPEFCGVSI
jgi:hypothetical protein